jgi:hypothetical protein
MFQVDWFVIARRVPLVQRIVGIRGKGRSQAVVDQFVGSFVRGCYFLVSERSAI